MISYWEVPSNKSEKVAPLCRPIAVPVISDFLAIWAKGREAHPCLNQCRKPINGFTHINWIEV